jgi:hypothetical protein
MTDAVLLEQISARWRMLDYSWMFYIFVAVIVLIAVATIKPSRTVTRIFAAAFGLFAVSNLLGMLYTIKQWHALADLLRSRVPSDLATDWAGAGLTDAPLAAWVLVPHLMADAFVLVSIFLIGRRISGEAVNN